MGRCSGGGRAKNPHRHDWVPLRRLQAAEGPQVCLHAIEVEDAQRVVVGTRQNARPAVVNVQSRHNLGLTCWDGSSREHFVCSGHEYTAGTSIARPSRRGRSRHLQAGRWREHEDTLLEECVQHLCVHPVCSCCPCGPAPAYTSSLSHNQQHRSKSRTAKRRN